MKRTVLWKYLKIYLDTDLKIILLDQERLNIDETLMNKAAKNFNILATSLNVYIIILIIQTKLFSDL